jgi:hypothetical protein
MDLTTSRVWRSVEHDRIFGYATPLAEWRDDVLLDHVFPEDRDSVNRELARARESDQLQYECRIIRADGTMRWISTTGRVSYNQYNAPRQ